MAAATTAISSLGSAQQSQLSSSRKRWSRLRPRASGNDGPNQEDFASGARNRVDWDKAWSSFRNSKRRSPFYINMDQYVTRNPRSFQYPLSEEVDQIRRDERMMLDAFTGRKFITTMSMVIGSMFVWIVTNMMGLT